MAKYFLTLLQLFTVSTNLSEDFKEESKESIEDFDFEILTKVFIIEKETFKKVNERIVNMRKEDRQIKHKENQNYFPIVKQISVPFALIQCIKYYLDQVLIYHEIFCPVYQSILNEKHW